MDQLQTRVWKSKLTDTILVLVVSTSDLVLLDPLRMSLTDLGLPLLCAL
jgi:hypothetical protein